jgi:hypothetical protein
MNAHILAPWCRPNLLLDRFQTEKNECPVAEIFCGQRGRDSDLFPVTLRLYTFLWHLESELSTVSRRNSKQWKSGRRLNQDNTSRKMLHTHLSMHRLHYRRRISANSKYTLIHVCSQTVGKFYICISDFDLGLNKSSTFTMFQIHTLQTLNHIALSVIMDTDYSSLSYYYHGSYKDF